MQREYSVHSRCWRSTVDVVPHDGSRLLLGLIVRARGRLVARAPSPSVHNKPGRPALLTESEVITLAILAQWPRFRSERDFWRFASWHLRPYFPMFCTQGQLNRRIRALQPELRELQRDFAEDLAQPSALYRVMDTTLVPAIVRVRASRKGLFLGLPSGGAPPRRPSGFTGSQGGFGGGPKRRGDGLRVGPGGLRRETHRRCPAGGGPLRCLPGLLKGFTGLEWERHWMEQYGALVAAPPNNDSRRAWSKAE